MHKVRRIYKLATIHALEKTGARIEIYGDNWEDEASPWNGNVRIHNRVSSEECLQLLGRSKIGLNCMPWFKKGCSERVFNIMLNGAVCLTDTSEFLMEQFSDGDDIVFYDLRELGALTEIANEILQNSDYASRIAKNGFEKAAKNHTWECRLRENLNHFGYLE